MSSFYKVNNEVLKFDIDKDIEEIRFNHWIMKKENYERLNNELEKGLFRMTVRQIEKDLGVTFHKARGLIKKFEKLGIIKVHKQAKSRAEASIYSYEVVFNSDEKNRTVCNTVSNTVSNTVNPSNSNECKGKDSTVNHTVGNTVNRTSKKENKKENKKDIYTRVVNKLNSTANTKYQASTKATQRLIDAKMNQGYKIEDLERVIDIKAKEWMGTEWEKYLRPATLFGSKFESYLNQKEKTPTPIGANKNNYNSSICKKTRVMPVSNEIDLFAN